MAGPSRGGAEKLRSTRRAPDGALWVGCGQGSPPENVERGGERGSPQLHRDENRGDRERASLENDAGASGERRGRAGDPPLRHRHAQASLERDSRLLFGLRAVSGGGSARGGADHLPQSLRKKKSKTEDYLPGAVSVPAFGCGLHSMAWGKSATPRGKKFLDPLKTRPGQKKNPEASKKLSCENFF